MSMNLNDKIFLKNIYHDDSMTKKIKTLNLPGKLSLFGFLVQKFSSALIGARKVIYYVTSKHSIHESFKHSEKMQIQYCSKRAL